MLTYLAMHWLLYKSMNHGGDGRVQDKRNQEEKYKDTDDGGGAEY